MMVLDTKRVELSMENHIMPVKRLFYMNTIFFAFLSCTTKTESLKTDTMLNAEDSGSTDSATDTSAVERAHKSLVLVWDGARPDAIAQANTPHLDSLIQGTWHGDYQGGYSPLAQNLYDATTVSGPNHATIMTGANGSQHGVTGNGDVGMGDFDSFPHYLQRLETHNSSLNTASLFTWSIDSLITSGADYVHNGEDADNVERAAAILAGTFNDDGWSMGTNADALFLFLDDSDHAGHAHGFELSISAYIMELEELDGQLGIILSALRARSGFEEEAWQIVLTSDHGGYHTGHGGESASEHTIPFLVVSRDVEQGLLPLKTSSLDVVPTVLKHMGLDIPSELTGTPRGGEVLGTPPSFNESLVRYYRFEEGLKDSSLVEVPATMGVHSDHDPLLHSSGGRFGGYVSIANMGGGADNSSYLTVGEGSDIEFEAGTAFTLTLWFRSEGEQEGDPLIVGNKDWNSGGNLGWLVSANEGGNNSFGANYASTSSDRVDVEDVDYNDTNWWFLGAVVHPGALVILYAGNAEGLRWIAYQYPDSISLKSTLPLNIGQDGTGEYGFNLDGAIDDFAIWRRGLHHNEIIQLYAGGNGVELETLR